MKSFLQTTCLRATDLARFAVALKVKLTATINVFSTRDKVMRDSEQ